jgi:hypothetical protein
MNITIKYIKYETHTYIYVSKIYKRYIKECILLCWLYYKILKILLQIFKNIETY